MRGDRQDVGPALDVSRDRARGRNLRPCCVHSASPRSPRRPRPGREGRRDPARSPGRTALAHRSARTRRDGVLAVSSLHGFRVSPNGVLCGKRKRYASASVYPSLELSRTVCPAIVRRGQCFPLVFGAGMSVDPASVQGGPGLRSTDPASVRGVLEAGRGVVARPAVGRETDTSRPAGARS